MKEEYYLGKMEIILAKVLNKKPQKDLYESYDSMLTELETRFSAIPDLRTAEPDRHRNLFCKTLKIIGNKSLLL